MCPTAGTPRAARWEAIANGDNGPPLGRELEIADLLRFIKRSTCATWSG